jgi:MFS family permease
MRIRKETGNLDYRSKLLPDVTFQQLFVQEIVRPMKMLICLPVVTLLCTYVSILYGILYLLFATYPFVFHETYGFSTFATGLVYIPGAAGTLLGLFYIGTLSDKTLRKRAAIGREVTPEDRLPLIITVPGVLMFPTGLFMYGWSGQAHTHWTVPMLGTAITGFGSILIFTAIQTYLVDAFQDYAASAVGANIMLRGIVGACIPIGGLGLYERLGWGWGNSLLAFVALVFAPVPLSIGVYGAKVRALKLFHADL